MKVGLGPGLFPTTCDFPGYHSLSASKSDRKWQMAMAVGLPPPTLSTASAISVCSKSRCRISGTACKAQTCAKDHGERVPSLPLTHQAGPFGMEAMDAGGLARAE